VEGEVESGKLYEKEDFNRIMEIKEREALRVKLFMEQIDQRRRRWSSLPHRTMRLPCAT
jgi:type I restriction enzyme R subunit